jgi:predicted amino acid racemase
MGWPRLVLYPGRIAENASRVTERCSSVGVEVLAVVKGVCADPRAARAMLDGGCASFADSRLQNLDRLGREFPGVPRTLLRIPVRSELVDVPRCAECSLVSMPESVEGLEDGCRSAGATHEVILMFDLGDRREGIPLRREGDTPELALFAEKLKKASRVKLRGVGANFGCFAGALPDAGALRRLGEVRAALERELGYGVPVCSGGSTSSLALLERGELPAEVNQLRVGEAILLGRDIARGREIPWLNRDTAFLEAEVAEARVRPSLPEGEIGLDAFGNARTFEDEGPRRRAIVAVGRQDVPPEGLAPLDAGVKVLGASSDHTLLDVTEAGTPPGWGDVLRFSVSYAALLALMTSPYVHKEYR